LRIIANLTNVFRAAKSAPRRVVTDVNVTFLFSARWEGLRACWFVHASLRQSREVRNSIPALLRRPRSAAARRNQAR